MQNLIFYSYISQNIDEIYAETLCIHHKQSGFESQVMSRITRKPWILTKGKCYRRGRRKGRGSLPVSVIHEHEKECARCTEKVQRAADFRSRNPIFKKKSFISDRAFSRLVSVDLTYRLSYVLRLIYRVFETNYTDRNSLYNRWYNNVKKNISFLRNHL